MKFNTYRARVDETSVRHRNVLEGDDCPVEGIQSTQQQQSLLRTLAETTTLQMCGSKPFERMKMFWNGHWIIEMEAVYKGTL